MRLEIKKLAAFEVELDDWAPPSRSDAWIDLTLGVGVAEEPGLNWFNVSVATPEAAASRRESGSRMGLLVSEDANSGSGVRKTLETAVARCCRPTWEASVEQLRQVFEWEYENYIIAEEGDDDTAP